MKDLSFLAIYVSPISVLCGIGWVITIAVRRAADRYGLLHHVWHVPLLIFGVYISVVSVLVLLLFP